MSTPQKAKATGSRWAWMSQAVASVESGLDRILSEEDEGPKTLAPKATKPQENGSASRASSDLNRSDSTSKTNDRLQARLAQAMNKKSMSRTATPQPTSEAASRSGTPALEIADPMMTDVVPKQSLDGAPMQNQEHLEENSVKPVRTSTGSTAPKETTTSSIPGLRLGSETNSNALAAPGTSGRLSAENPRLSQDASSRLSLSDTGPDQDATLFHVQLQHEKSLSALQEEINGYLERIDALQRNLQILTKDTIESSKQMQSNAESTPHAKQLAEKDEKIALLIEEGMKLTKGEMQYRSTIKKLRAQAMTLTRDQDAVRARAEKAEKSVSLLELRATKSEAEAKQATSQMAKLLSDIDAITKERNALKSTLAEVRTQLSKAIKRAEDAESRAQSEKVEIERRKVAELEDDLNSTRVESELAEDKLKREIEDLKQKLRREKDQARQMENEMLAEQAVLEGKLESFRVRAEEASSNDHGDSQAKLLRQVETLQSQYSAASQNWQGIESTLLARITAIEQERDDAVSREADLRRKLRDSTSKAKTAAKELEEVQQALNQLQDQQDHDRAETQKAAKHARSLQDQVTLLQKELEEQKTRGEKDTARRLEEERTKWITLLPQGASRVESPAAYTRRTAGSFMDSLVSPLERPISQRSSTQPVHDPSIPSSRMNSVASIRGNGTLPAPDTPSITAPDDSDDFFANTPATPASPTRAESVGRLNEVISASTAAAGPSVQLVERLSTAVRRLESEKAASKDELARLSTQRDEARQEVVNLMREVEQKRAAEERLAKLEKEHAALSGKYDRTLELLGEKSEQVEELKADIVDVKQMYRQLADTMGK